jgi:hypothetical protein
MRRVGFGKTGADSLFGAAVGSGDRVEKIASFMVNHTARPEMRQNDHTGFVGQGVGGGQEGLEFKLFGIRHGESLEAVLPWESRFTGLGPRTARA